MALFGSDKDASFLRHVNRELLHNIISQQCAFYKFKLNETETNIYGEAPNGKFYDGPVLFNALIDIKSNDNEVSDLGPDFKWPLIFYFLRDDLVDANLVPEIGDIILFQESYFEVDNVDSTQLWGGKEPDYPYSTNPLNPGLEAFGYSVSITCTTHYIPSDKVNINKSRL